MIENFCALTLALAVAFCAKLNWAQATNGRFQKQLQPIIEQAMQQGNIPGFAIAIVQNREVVYAQGFGVRSLDRKDEKVTPLSLFHMASITKLFVATAVMQLVEKGKVDLDAPVVKYLPYFRLQDDRYTSITVRQMLSHISGMPDVRDYEWDKPQYDDGALERYVRSLSSLSLIAPPGTKWQYSNMAYEVLGDLIAKGSGEPFEGYVQQHILTPLGMKSSTLLLKEANPQLLTSPHVLDDAYEVTVSKTFPYREHPTVSHSGGDVGFVSNLVMIPDQSLAVVLMSSFDRAPLRAISNAALDVALGLPPDPIVIKPSIAKAIFKTIVNQGVEAAVRQYHDLKQHQPEAYDFRERELNELGYKLIAKKNLETAIAVFQLNVEAYPASSNVYDSLGEAYMLNGEATLALKNYEKSLELDPANGNAVEMLKKLKGQ